MKISLPVPEKEAYRLAGTRVVMLAFLGAMSMILLANCSTASPPERQTMVHSMGAHVMPFDLNKTVHVFEMTESGGIQDVIIIDDRDKDQIPLIQRHLQHEAMLFKSGDFSDPISLHGGDMPGVKDLSDHASQIQADYSPLPNGARITFTTSDLHLITAIHRWFGAQLSDHGSDATYR